MTAPVQGAPQQVTNYLIPSSGGTMSVPFLGTFSATPFNIDWRQFTIDQEPFIPQGAFIDNTQGTGTLSITILGINWKVNVPAGDQAQVQFPAPTGMQMSIVGLGFANIQFVNFPVLPSGQQVSVTGTVNVDVVGPNPLPVSAPVNVAGVPYQINVVPLALTNHQGIINGAAVSYDSGALPAGTNLYKLFLNVLAQSTLGAAAELTVTVTLNGVQIWQGFPLIPAAASTTPGIGLMDKEISFPAGVALPTLGGHLVVTISAALATGALVVNAYVG